MKTLLPVKEFMHPLSLFCVFLLGFNDHFLKDSGIMPGWFTGKLSDVAGIIFFPLLLTALANTTASGINYLSKSAGFNFRLDHSLKRWKSLLACGITAFCLSSIQFSPVAVSVYSALVAWMGFPFRATMDPTDLLALLFLPVPYFIAVSVIGEESDRPLIKNGL